MNYIRLYMSTDKFFTLRTRRKGMLSHFFNKGQPQQTNPVQVGQNIPYGLFENDSDAVKEFLLRQHDRLASEQVSRITHRDNLKLVLSGTIVGIAAFVLQYPLVALAYPIIAMFIAADWESYDQRIHHIAHFLSGRKPCFWATRRKCWAGNIGVEKYSLVSDGEYYFLLRAFSYQPKSSLHYIV